jgi:hypothetical protein
VFLFDRADGTVQYVSATSGAATASNGISGGAIVSADGSRVAFISNGTNLVTGQDPGSTSFNVYLLSRSVTSSILASGVLSSPIRGGNDDAYPPALDAAGDVVAFQSYASNLVLGDYNGASDIFAFSLRYEGAAATFQTLPPCRVADTRGASGPWGSPALAGNASRTFALALRCGIPSDAVAVSANVTVVGPASSGTLTFYPAGFSGGGTSTVSYRAGQTRANNAILGLGGAGATVVDVSGPGSVDLVIDVNGYFK